MNNVFVGFNIYLKNILVPMKKFYMKTFNVTFYMYYSYYMYYRKILYLDLVSIIHYKLDSIFVPID